MKGKKREPWRIVVGILVIAFIVYMWVEKDIASTYTAAVTLLKVAAMAGGILLVKWIIGKFKK